MFLFIATVLIIIWESLSGQNYLSANFFIKFSITGPILYYAIFAQSQCNQSKNLYNEYKFKASVARYFEAYRQIFKEDGLNQDNRIETNVLSFFIDTVKNIYQSPRKVENDLVSDQQARGVVEKIIDAFVKSYK